MAMTPRRALGFALALTAFAVATVTRADADLWGHLRFGLDFLRDRRLPAVDPYSFTQDVPWINHEWLSEAQMALAWALGRSMGLTMLKSALVTTGLATVYTSLRRTTIAVRAIVIVAIVLGTIHMWATLRPQLWTFVAVSLLCRALVSRRRAVTWLLPILFAVWVNCHGGWIVGLGILGAWTLGQALARSGDLSHWVLVTLACAAATLVNPYGWGLWLFMLRTVHMTRDVAEWAPLWTAPWVNWLPWIAGCGLVLWMCWPRLARPDTRERAPE